LLWDPEGEHDACAEANQNVLAAIVADPRLTDVVLVARWAYYFEGRPYGNEQLPAAWPRSLQSDEGAKRRAAAIESALDQTVARLVAAGRRVWVVGPIPEVGWDAPSVLARASMYGWTVDIDPLASDFFARQKPVFSALDRLAASAGVRVLYPHERLCGAKTCAVSSDGVALYSDFSHLSREGDVRVAPVLAPIFQPAASGAVPASP
jgi:hypothetical protein